MKQIFSVIIFVYQVGISPFKPYASCRFHPTCSQYAKIAVARHGALKGGGLAFWRICRCHPWSKGGEDFPSE